MRPNIKLFCLKKRVFVCMQARVEWKKLGMGTCIDSCQKCPQIFATTVYVWGREGRQIHMIGKFKFKNYQKRSYWLMRLKKSTKVKETPRILLISLSQVVCASCIEAQWFARAKHFIRTETMKVIGR